MLFGISLGFLLSGLAAFSTLAKESALFSPPLPRASERVTKKPFGLYTSPKTSPVKPERFSGYHTGADFEIFAEEKDRPVQVTAICAGKLLAKQRVSGYGGAAVQSCVLDGQAVAVLYGHLQLASIKQKIGTSLKAGDNLALLGADNSYDTDKERKHLHLAIHKGKKINWRGYVKTKSELKAWLDPVARF